MSTPPPAPPAPPVSADGPADRPAEGAKWPWLRNLTPLEAGGAVFQIASGVVTPLVTDWRNIPAVGASAVLVALAVRAVSGQPWTRQGRVLAGAEVGLFAVLIALAISLRHDDAGPAAAATSAPVRPAPQRSPGLGDPRAADPCALLSTAELSSFGEPHLEARAGNFSRCDVILESRVGEIGVRVELDAADPGSGGGTGADGITVVRDHQQDGECDRLLVLGDGNEVAVTAMRHEGPGPFRLCPIADRAATTARRVLVTNGDVPRRTTPLAIGSLARRDACTLLSSEAITRVAGISGPNADPGFADWSCRWTNGASDISVSLRFDQDSSLDTDDGDLVRVGNRDVYVDPGGDGDGTCVARVAYRRYYDANQEPVVELVILRVDGPHPTAQLCPAATTLAGSLSL